MCSLCESGYTGPQCSACPEKVLTYVEILAFVLLYVGTITFTMFQALRKDQGTKVNPLTVGFKMMVTYLQTLGQLAPLFPGIPATIMKGYDIVGNVYIPADAVRCVKRTWDGYPRCPEAAMRPRGDTEWHLGTVCAAVDEGLLRGSG